MTEETTRGDMKFEVVARSGVSRVGKLHLKHAVVETPVFMPVGTQGTMKGVLPSQLLAMDCRILLSNTYHLGHRPGNERVRAAGGLHKMMHWPRAILTDSGGFQMVSLAKLMSITEEAVDFESPHTGEQMHMTPEMSISIQQDLGADIMMQLDHVVHVLTESKDQVEEAMQRSVRWLDRCRVAHPSQDVQALFPIIQGGLDLEMRRRCVQMMAPKAEVGLAIGGLSGGESKDQFWRVVAECCAVLPPHLPRYVMGVGWALDLVVCSLLGADMFDCVYPTRTARFGSAMVRRGGEMNLTNRRFESDKRPIEVDCECETCKGGYTRAYIHMAINNETVGCHLISVHNIHHHLSLMKRLRRAIEADERQAFLTDFLVNHFCETRTIPNWVRDAIRHVGLSTDEAEKALGPVAERADEQTEPEKKRRRAEEN